MKILILTNPGLEAASSKEIYDLFKIKAQILSEGKLICDLPNEKLFDVYYKLRTVTRIILLTQKFSFEKTPLECFKPFESKQSFQISGERTGSHNFTSFELTQKIAEKIKGNYDIKRGEITYYFVVDHKTFFWGIDLAGFDLGKRHYRLFLGPENLKGNIAATLLHLADFSSKKKLIDPFCRSGIIPIEAVLISTNTSPHLFNKNDFSCNRIKEYSECKERFEQIDKLKEDKDIFIYALDPLFNHISASKKNATLAGVQKKIKFSRTDLNWIDLKFEDNSIDCIVTQPPGEFKKSELLIKKAHRLLSFGGILVLYVRDKDKTLELCTNFSLKQIITVKQGKETWFGLKLIKK